MEDSGKHRFHDLEHDSKMRLFTTYSHTSTLRGYGASRKMLQQKTSNEERKTGKRVQNTQANGRIDRRESYHFHRYRGEYHNTGSRAFSAAPRHTRGTRQVFDGWIMPCCRLCVSFNCFSSRVPGSIARPLEVWEWVLRSRIFDSWPSSWNRSFPDSPLFLHIRLIRVG